jgi:hypothetical protein
MRTMRIVCLLALPVGALLCSLTGAGAQGTPEARQACTPDAMRLCSEFIPDADRVKSCMLSKRSQLSAECRAAMTGGGGAKHAARHHRERAHHIRHSRHSR